MPFEIVRNDIVNMRVDAIVNTANPRARVGSGIDSAVHKKAGPQLLEARKAIGEIGFGQAAVTPGFGLDANYVIHAVGPVWQDGTHGEEQLLRRCYDRALELALEYECGSVAFPLISAGNHGFPKKIALKVAIRAFGDFLMEHDMRIYLVVFGRESVELSGKLFRAVESYIDENYIFDKRLDEYGVVGEGAARKEDLEERRETLKQKLRRRYAGACDEAAGYGSVKYPVLPAASHAAPPDQRELMRLLEQTDAGFSETLLRLIDRAGRKDSEIYRKANVSRKLFFKIKTNPDYHPTKATALAFAIALELDLEETRDFIGRAGYAFSRSSKFDIIVEFFIRTGNYDVFELNEVLYEFDQPLIGV